MRYEVDFVFEFRNFGELRLGFVLCSFFNGACESKRELGARYFEDTVVFLVFEY